jgi:phosphonopyruvate decarboxylase
MQIPCEDVPQAEAEIASVIERAVTHMTRVRTPYALVMKKDSVESYKLQTKASPRALPALTPDTTPWSKDLPSRTDVLRVVQKAARPNDALVATTGYTGRELYALEDKANQIYMVGSMGCASSFGLGIAWAKPNKRAVVLDGDGAALMRLGALATLGYERPKNLLHIVLDNEAHDSTGGQSTVSHSVDFVAIAKACGYPKALRVASLEELGNVVAADHDALTFVHVKTKPGAPKDLPRPTVTPLEVGDRLRQWLAT